MAVIRDLQCSQDVAEMVKLGRFDSEFIVYGCCYQENDSVRYYISANEADVYAFIDGCPENNLYPTSINKLLNRCAVPSGLGEDIMQQTKILLARQMKRKYTTVYHEAMRRLSAMQANDSALPMLLKMQEAIDGRFNTAEIDLFDETMHYAYRAKVLTPEGYQRFSRWLKNMRGQMADDIIVKDVFERTFHGLAYQMADGEWRYYVDAQKTALWEKKNVLENRGVLSTPIWSKCYWFGNLADLGKCRQQYQQILEEMFSLAYLCWFSDLVALPSAIPAEVYGACLQQLVALGDTAGIEELEQYGRRWHCN